MELLRGPEGVQAVVRWSENTAVNGQPPLGAKPPRRPTVADSGLTGRMGAAPTPGPGAAAGPPGRSGGAPLSLPFANPLTHDLRFLLGIVILGARHLHLHERTNDSPSIFGKVPGPQDLGREQERLGKRRKKS